MGLLHKPFIDMRYNTLTRVVIASLLGECFAPIIVYDFSQAQMSGQKRNGDSKFKITQKGEMSDSGGVDFAFTSYQAPDGTKLIHIYHEFDSPDQARQYLEREVHKATKIIKRSEKKD